MILREIVRVQVLLLLVTCVVPQSVLAGSSSKSKGKSSSSSGSSKSSKYRSGHQYGSSILRPSKPDPHFEILDEQRAYYNYGGKLREGRSSSLSKKTSQSQNVKSSDYKKKCCTQSKRGKSSSSNPSTTVLREVASPSLQSFSGSGSSSMEVMGSTFTKKSLDQNQYPSQMGFSGSQLISGDVGMISPKMMRNQKVDWKILMGPSVSPTEEEEYRTTPDFEKRSFTSITDGGVAKHKTITKLNEISSQKRKAKESQYQSTNFSVLPEHFSTKGGKSSRGRVTYKSSSLRNMEASMPKHKYVQVTKKGPSKSKSYSQQQQQQQQMAKHRSSKKVQMSMSQNSKNLFKASTPIKPSSSRYVASTSGSFEEDLNSLRSSAVMTLDTKKLMIEPDINSVEPTVQNTMVSSMSREAYSGEKHDDLTPLPSESTLVSSRYDPIPLHDMMEEEHGTGDDGIRYSYSRDDDGFTDFQTKTALNPSSSEYPSFSVGASMNYAKAKGTTHRMKTGMGIVTSASDEIPQSAPQPPKRSRGRARYQNIRHHVDDIQTFPSEDIHLSSLSPEVLDPPNRLDNRGFVVNTVVQHPPPQALSEYAGLGSSKLPGHSHLLATHSPPPQPPPSPEILTHPPEPTPGFQGNPMPYPDPSHHVPYILPPHYPPHPPHPYPPHRRPPFPPPPPHHHHHHHPHLPFHRHPPPPLPPLSKPIFPPPPPLDGGSGRKAPPGEFTVEIGKLVPGHSPPPPIGIDPAHPVVQHALRNPQSILNDGIYIEPTDSSSIQETTKKYLQNLHYSVHKNTLIPLDKRLVYLSMIFSWMFWITTFYTYYRYSATGSHNNKFTLTVPHNGEDPHVVTTRSLDPSSPWNFTKVLEYIEIAQKTYEGFDWQDLNCQKRNLCELVQKQSDPWGETGRKLANSYVYRIMDALDGVPIPQLIQTYLRQYKEAITQGKNSKQDCGQIYPQCKFSIKDVLAKASQKKKA